MPRLSLKGRLIVSHGEQLFAIHRRWQFRFKGARDGDLVPASNGSARRAASLEIYGRRELEASEFFSEPSPPLSKMDIPYRMMPLSLSLSLSLCLSARLTVFKTIKVRA